MALALIGAMAACGPIPVERAERACLRDAELAVRPRTSVAVGIGAGPDGGTRGFGNVSLEMSGDYLMGRDPAQVFDRCVQRRAGQPPRRPLAQQPGWTG